MLDKYEILKRSSLLRKKFGEDDTSPIDIFRLAVARDELTLIFFPMGKNISGVCIKRFQDIVIGVNSAMSYGRQRFSLAHELYHAHFGSEIASTLSGKKIGENRGEEKEADQFASFFLIPPNGLAFMTDGHEPTIKDVVKLEQFFGVSRQAMLYRLLDEGYITPQKAEAMKTGVIASALSCGYDDALYRPLPEKMQYMTQGAYIKQANGLLERGLISRGKHEELLLDAFRPDIVYGIDDEGRELLD